MKNVYIKIDEDVLNRIKILAKIQGSPYNNVINDILYGFIFKNDAAIKEFENAAKKFYEKVKW